MLSDQFGSPLTTASEAARDAYVEGIYRFLGGMDGPEESFSTSIAEDENFAMARLALARTHMTAGRGAEAKAALLGAQERRSGVTDREAAQIGLIGDLIGGKAQQAYPLIRAHVAEYPRDVLPAQASTGVFGLIGFSGKAGREAEQLAYTTALLPHYADDWWFLCQHAFAQMEAGQPGPAEANIEHALNLRPDSAHSAHVRAHLHYETGETQAGLAYLEGFWKGYSETALMHCHISWHIAIWALAEGNIEQMWRVFDAYVSPDRTPAPALNILTDSASLLHRAALAGVAVPQERWKQLSDYATTAFPKPGLAFADVHAALAHAMAGEADRLKSVIDGAKGPAAPVVSILGQAFGALADGAPDEAERLLTGVMAEHERIGGSRAQRDLIEFTLANTLLRMGNREEARRLLDMRRPHVAHDHAVAGLFN